MLPAILKHAKCAFAYLKPEARQEAVQEVVASACQAFVRMVGKGKIDIAHPMALARHGFKQTRDHRKVRGHLNIGDPLGRYCQTRKGVVVEKLDHFHREENAWTEAVVDDTRTAQVSDSGIVASRADFADWLKTLDHRDRRIAESLSLGTPPATSRESSSSAPVGSAHFARSSLKAGGSSSGTSASWLPPRMRKPVVIGTINA